MRIDSRLDPHCFEVWKVRFPIFGVPPFVVKPSAARQLDNTLNLNQ